MQNPGFHRLVRFRNEEGKILLGDVVQDISDDATLAGMDADVFEGVSPFDPGFCRTGRREQIHQVLCPLPSVPIILGIGLNYRHHAEEVKMDPPPTPPLFYKPPEALAGPVETIHIHPTARCLDYEGELCVVIGRDCKNLAPDEDPLDYVLGYTVGNDLSSRYWQTPAISSNQANYAKGFDGFAPIGPTIASCKVVPDPSCLLLTTHVNGVERQRAWTDDLIFNIPEIVRFLSTGRTLRQGTVIMTGTPSGVISGMKDKAWLKDGDIVQVAISSIGKITNTISMDS